MADNERVATTADAEENAGEMSEAEIDQNLADTFPASDPPSWTLGTDHGEQTPGKPTDDQNNTDAK